MKEPYIFHWHVYSKHSYDQATTYIELLTGHNICNIVSKKSQQLAIRKKYPTGFTVAILDGKMGLTLCSENDQFCRRTGRRIALERLRGNPICLTNP